MRRAMERALNAATEITVARVSNSTTVPNQTSGEQVADFFEAVYNRIYEIAAKGDEG